MLNTFASLLWRTAYLNTRVYFFWQVGGAYGGFSDFDSHSGMYTYLSYRDPNVLKTIESYDGTPDFLRTLELDNDALTKAIIGTIGDIDSYQLPDSKVRLAVLRCVTVVEGDFGPDATRSACDGVLARSWC